MLNIKNELPPEVITEYSLGEQTELVPLSGGMINSTYLVKRGETERMVLQRLSSIFDARMIEDYSVVAEHLQQEGWEIPAIIKTHNKALHVTDSTGNIWRAFEFLASDKVDNVQEYSVYGDILGRLHVSLRTLDYRPQFKLSNFHNTAYYADDLAKVCPDLPSEFAQDFADKLLNTYVEFPELPDVGQQLIHGDPRTDNILHRDGSPFTFIDWDTLMLGTVWMDLGDMLRSLAENDIQAGRDVSIETLTAVCEGYRQVAQATTNPGKFEIIGLRAGQLIALELAIRFVRDYKDGDEGYFLWDDTHYTSRHAHNMQRAKNQWKIFTQIQKYIEAKHVAV